MATVSMKEMLKAGVHFGHQARYWNPKMKKFIFGARNKIHIINLEHTVPALNSALEQVQALAARKKKVLFVGTKRAAGKIIKEQAERAGMPYVDHRWLGGMLTNYQTVKKQVKKLKELEAGSEDGSLANYTKKEQLLMSRQREKLSKYLSGIKTMNRLPGLLFIIDSKKERIAVSEANKLGVPIVAIVDTNADPDLITVPIAGNDDAIRSVELITKVVADTIDEARREAPARPQEEEQEAYTFSSDRGAERADRGDRGGRDSRGGGDRGGNNDRGGRPRRRRAKPEAIAARLKGGDAGAEGGDDAAPAEGAE